MEEGFKVVFVQGSELFSVCERLAEVAYAIGKVTKPLKNCGPLCVFDNEEDARKFKMGTDAVYKCKYSRSKHDRVWNRDTSTSIMFLPKGTVLADEVILTEELLPNHP